MPGLLKDSFRSKPPPYVGEGLSRNKWSPATSDPPDHPFPLKLVPPSHNKLAGLNLNPYLFRWIVNYLHQRTQAVGVDGETSATLPVVSGVPQGLVLGPLLFLIYIDGLSRIQLCDGTLIDTVCR